MANKSNYIIQTVDHALDVLEQFHDNVDELGFSDLCKCLNIQKNKIFRILATLEFHNIIEQNKDTSNYRLGQKSLQLGQTFIKHTGLLQQARPVLELINNKCNETSSLAVLRDIQIICLDAIESNLPVRVVPRIGKRLPFYCTAAGKVIAAGLNENAMLDICKSSNLTRYTPNTIIDLDELLKQLRKISELGYTVNDEELDIGVKCIGAPVRDYTKRIVGAVSVSAPSMRLTSERINNELIPLVIEAAEDLSCRLGFRS